MLSFLLLKKANFSDLKSFASDVYQKFVPREGKQEQINSGKLSLTSLRWSELRATDTKKSRKMTRKKSLGLPSRAIHFPLYISSYITWAQRDLWRPFSKHQITVYRLLSIWTVFSPMMSYLSAVEMMNMWHDRQNEDALNVSTILALYFLYPFSHVSLRTVHVRSFILHAENWA